MDKTIEAVGPALRRTLLAGLSLAALAAPAMAQQAAPQPKQVEGVTVKAAPTEAVRTSIDRRSYNVTSDLQASGGSISDALRNIPGAEIDVQGNLSLRGGRVAIMIDGQPSALFSGQAAAQALQAMPADRIDRVEVITNPTAAFSPEGPTGIINLVTKKTAPAGPSGAIRANLGDTGRANAAGNVSYVTGKLTLSADGGWRRDPQRYDIVTTGTQADPITGLTAPRNQTEQDSGALNAWTGHAGFEYQLDPKTRLSGEARYNTFSFDRSQDFSYLSGAPLNAYTHTGAIDNSQTVALGQLTLRHQFPGQDHTLVLFLNHSRTNYRNENAGTDLTTLPAPPVSRFQEQFARTGTDTDQFKADYVRPMPMKGQLKAGVDVRAIDALFDNYGILGADEAHAVLQPVFSNLFRYRQTVSAAYATYEQPVGKWTVLGGLRIEDERLTLNQITQTATVQRDDLEVFPSLHLSYSVSPTTQWVLSYSSRIQRPGPFDLNPFRNLADPYTIRMGNPALKPEETQSFEGGWQFRRGATSYLATLFYRQSERGVTDVITPLAAGVLLVTKENLSSSRNAGLELVAAAPLSKTLTYNVSTDLYWNQIQAPALGVMQTRQQFTASGRGSVSWSPTKTDLFQLNGQINAGRLIPQGSVDPLFILFAGYRHKFTEQFALVATAQDPFGTIRQRTRIDGSGIVQDVRVNPHIQGAFIGFTWTLGGGGGGRRPQRDPGFDFSVPSTPGP